MVFSTLKKRSLSSVKPRKLEISYSEKKRQRQTIVDTKNKEKPQKRRREKNEQWN